MSDAYRQLLDATIADLERQQQQGRRFVVVSPPALAALKSPPARPAAAPPAAAPRLTPIRSLSAAAVTPAPRWGQAAEPPAPAAAPVAPLSDRPALTGEAKLAALADLRTRVLACVQCPRLVATRHSVVFGVGNPDADLMFVGEAPGEEEDRRGEPFVGAAGQLLTKIIETMGLTREQVYIANVLKCRPDAASGNRKPTPEEMAICGPWLREQIELVRPRVLVGLGATALEGLLGGRVAITRERGQWREYRGLPLMPTFHPAYLLYQNSLSEKRKLWEDMLAVLERLGLPVTDKQRRFFLKA